MAGFSLHFNHHMAPAPANRPHIKTTCSVEHDLVGAPASHQVLEKVVDEDREVWHQKRTNPFRCLAGKKIAGRIKNKLLALDMT